jgi:hypothetical protein
MSEDDLKLADEIDALSIAMETAAMSLHKYSAEGDVWRTHALELLGAAKVAQGWAEALYRIAEGGDD